MAGHRDVTVFYDERMLAHRPDLKDEVLPGRLQRRVRDIVDGLPFTWAYPEVPGRLTSIVDLLARDPVPGARLELGAVAEPEQLARVHTTSYVEGIRELRGQAAWLDTDTTAVSAGSVEAAEVAAGTAIKAVEAVAEGRTSASFAVVRPPGHHAEPVRARGFCLFNNVAVAAAHAQAALGLERVLIVDWDAHHGNGTQEIFWSSHDVMHFDTHRAAPFYPGSGHLEDVGGGWGEGTTINVPLPAGTGDPAMVRAFREILVPAADHFRPDLVLVSAGFDAHRLDLTLNLTYDGFAALTGIVQEIADRHCDGRLTMVLEGGYHQHSLASGVRSVLEVMAGAGPPEPEVLGLREVDEAIHYHRAAFDDPPSA